MAGVASTFEPGRGFPAPVDIDTRYVASSTASIIEAACALESTINEVRSNMESPSEQSFGKALTDVPTMRRLWTTVERTGTLSKVQWILLLGHCEAFDEGAEPFQSASDVMAMRNEHFSTSA